LSGSFVASAGLESFVTHGFSSLSGAASRKKDKVEYTVDYVRDSVKSYARSALPFVSEAHTVMREKVVMGFNGGSLEEALRDMQDIDHLYEAMTLNHVARRASKTQGVALLSLYSKGFTRPPVVRGQDDIQSDEHERDAYIGTFIDKLKLLVRREDAHGHLPTCWGVLTAALGLSLGADVLFFLSVLILEFTYFMSPNSTTCYTIQSEANSCTFSSMHADCYLLEFA
jgi:urease accessory protein